MKIFHFNRWLLFKVQEAYQLCNGNKAVIECISAVWQEEEQSKVSKAKVLEVVPSGNVEVTKM